MLLGVGWGSLPGQAIKKEKEKKLMNKKNEEKIEKVREIIELAEKYDKEVNVDMTIYSYPEVLAIIEEAKKIYKGRLRKEHRKSGEFKWIRFHNAPKGKDYIASDLKINIFYPRKKEGIKK